MKLPVFRRVTSRLGRLILLTLVIALLGALLVGLRSLPGFEVERLILPQTRYLAAADLATALQPAAGKSLFAVETEALEERLLALPYVKQAKVHRRFPDALDVWIEEREPFARMRGVDGRTWALAEDGRVLSQIEGESDLVLFRPVVAPSLKPGGTLPEELRVLLPLAERLGSEDAWPDEPRIESVSVSAHRGAVLVLRGGVEVRLGTVTQLDDKLMVARQIIKNYLSQGRELHYVDVYLPERPVAKEKSP